MRTALIKAFGLQELNASEAAQRTAELKRDFPASAAVQLLHLHYHQQPAGPAEAIYFRNPYWLQYLLTTEEKDLVTVEPSEGPLLPESSSNGKSVPREMLPDLSEESKGTVEESLPPVEEELDEEKERPEITDSPALGRIGAILSQQAAMLRQELPEGEIKVPVDPHHAIDFFAAVGVEQKPAQASQPAVQPELTRKMYTFTEWLKQMKRSNFATAGANVNPQQEAAVALQAQRSNTLEEVITEAMAEVYIKQGRTDQAKIIFRKLIESDPSKSAYFAARIENLI